MSFDPQPIRLKGYTSTYVDPKYDVMLESLNKRYETRYINKEKQTHKTCG